MSRHMRDDDGHRVPDDGDPFYHPSNNGFVPITFPRMEPSIDELIDDERSILDPTPEELFELVCDYMEETALANNAGDHDRFNRVGRAWFEFVRMYPQAHAIAEGMQ